MLLVASWVVKYTQHKIMNKIKNAKPWKKCPIWSLLYESSYGTCGGKVLFKTQELMDFVEKGINAKVNLKHLN